MKAESHALEVPEVLSGELDSAVAPLSPAFSAALGALDGKL
jgi:hypothetical protein